MNCITKQFDILHDCLQKAQLRIENEVCEKFSALHATVHNELEEAYLNHDEINNGVVLIAGLLQLADSNPLDLLSRCDKAMPLLNRLVEEKQEYAEFCARNNRVVQKDMEFLTTLGVGRTSIDKPPDGTISSTLPATVHSVQRLLQNISLEEPPPPRPPRSRSARPKRQTKGPRVSNTPEHPPEQLTVEAKDEAAEEEEKEDHEDREEEHDGSEEEAIAITMSDTEESVDTTSQTSRALPNTSLTPFDLKAATLVAKGAEDLDEVDLLRWLNSASWSQHASRWHHDHNTSKPPLHWELLASCPAPQLAIHSSDNPHAGHRPSMVEGVCTYLSRQRGGRSAKERLVRVEASSTLDGDPNELIQGQQASHTHIHTRAHVQAPVPPSHSSSVDTCARHIRSTTSLPTIAISTARLTLEGLIFKPPTSLGPGCRWCWVGRYC